MRSLAIILFTFVTAVSFGQTGTFEFKPLNDLEPGNKNTIEFKKEYAIAIRYYNTAIEVINNIDADASTDELIATQEKAHDLASKALPHFEYCHKILPKHEEVNNGIEGCKLILNEPAPEDK